MPVIIYYYRKFILAFCIVMTIYNLCFFILDKIQIDKVSYTALSIISIYYLSQDYYKIKKEPK